MLFASPDSPFVQAAETARLAVRDTPSRRVRLPALTALANLTRAMATQRGLAEWHRAQPRPAAFRSCPERVWQRRSALITLIAEVRRP